MTWCVLHFFIPLFPLCQDLTTNQARMRAEFDLHLFHRSQETKQTYGVTGNIEIWRRALLSVFHRLVTCAADFFAQVAVSELNTPFVSVLLT